MADQPLELYPLRTEPVFRHYIWGGDKLGPLLGKPMGPDGTLAESWEIADEARVANGPLAGRTLREVDEASGGALVGDGPRYPNAQVPLLIKLSHAAQDLSVQIHPNDEQARRDEPERGYPGKAEMYFIMEADPGAGVYWGLRDGVTPQQLKDAARAASGVADLINFVPVTAGDVLYSPAGVVHAIGKGIVYCEVQEDSDITYRLYDWGRVDAQGKPRPLHLEQAMRVLAPSSRSTPEVRPLALRATRGSPAPCSAFVRTSRLSYWNWTARPICFAPARPYARLSCWRGWLPSRDPVRNSPSAGPGRAAPSLPHFRTSGRCRTAMPACCSPICRTCGATSSSRCEPLATATRISLNWEMCANPIGYWHPDSVALLPTGAGTRVPARTSAGTRTVPPAVRHPVPADQGLRGANARARRRRA